MDASSSLPDDRVPALSALPSVAPPPPVAESASLPSLTRRMAAGRDDAFREFHAAWFSRIFRYVFVLMRGDEHAACDVTQETLLRVVRHIRAFEAEDEFWGWLTCLARSAAADHGRKVSRYRRLLERFAGENIGLASEPDSDLSTAIQHGLGQLGEADRLLLQQKYSGGASVRQLAASTGASEAAIESRLARARRELRSIVLRITGHEEH